MRKLQLGVEQKGSQHKKQKKKLKNLTENNQKEKLKLFQKELMNLPLAIDMTNQLKT